MNFQIVLCPGLNDGEALNKTLSDLTAKENVNSVAVVPVGLTAHREKLYPLQPFTRETALAAVKQIEAFGDRMVAEKGMRLVMAADELYLKAGLPLPPYDDYEDFPQLENGVGMLTLFDHEFTRALEDLTPGLLPRYLIATGEAAYPFLKEWVDRFNQRFHTSHEVRSVKNLLFGGEVTVAGLLSGGDLAAALGDCSGQGFSALLLANSMLRSGEPVFLDDSTPDDLAEKIGLGVRFIDPDGTSFAQALAGQL